MPRIQLIKIINNFSILSDMQGESEERMKKRKSEFCLIYEQNVQIMDIVEIRFANRVS